MKYIYMSLTITVYSNRYSTDCNFYEAVDDGEMTRRHLTYAEAQKLQWELVKAGATRTFHPNMFNNAISHIEIGYWMRH